jgi:hypothetical protein
MFAICMFGIHRKTQKYSSWVIYAICYILALNGLLYNWNARTFSLCSCREICPASTLLLQKLLCRKTKDYWGDIPYRNDTFSLDANVFFTCEENCFLLQKRKCWCYLILNKQTGPFYSHKLRWCNRQPDMSYSLHQFTHEYI